MPSVHSALFILFFKMLSCTDIEHESRSTNDTRRSEAAARYQARSGTSPIAPIIKILSTSGAWMFVCCDCCVLPGRGLCDELITRPEESYRLWCVVEYDLENSKK